MKRAMIAATLAALGCLPQLAEAGPFADDMAKCLVTSSSPEDRLLLTKWIFGIITLHPDLMPMSAITPQQRDQTMKSAGALIQRLLTESCRSQTQLALQNEGPQTIQYAFQVLGASAMQGLLGDAHVKEGAASIAKYLDEAKIKELMNAPPK